MVAQSDASNRIVFVLDVTVDEARTIADQLDDLGITEFEGMGLRQMVEVGLGHGITGPYLPVGVRSAESTALGNPGLPDLAPPRDDLLSGS